MLRKILFCCLVVASLCSASENDPKIGDFVLVKDGPMQLDYRGRWAIGLVQKTKPYWIYQQGGCILGARPAHHLNFPQSQEEEQDIIRTWKSKYPGYESIVTLGED